MLLKSESVSKLSIIKFTEPLFAVIFSGLILGEDIFKLSYLVALVLLLLALLTENGAWKSIRKKENKK
jgi:drug/metabolite transporter (DMT)-like permease